MCGIYGCISKEGLTTVPITIEGLRRQEYRGYDSTGIALLDGQGIFVHKKKGKLKVMEQSLPAKSAHVSIGHTRWATHGDPSDVNAHPIVDNSGRFALVHNGIIENYLSIQQELSAKGYSFHTQTDTEILVNLISYQYDLHAGKLPMLDVLCKSLRQVKGAYSICLITPLASESIFIARHGSPLLIGLGRQAIHVASDSIAFTDAVQELVYMNDGEVGVIRRDGSYSITNLSGVPQEKARFPHKDAWHIDKNQYAHFMLKEIEEQPSTLKATWDALLGDAASTLSLHSPFMDVLTRADRIHIVACGTSYHAGMVGQYYMEKATRIAVEVSYASEFRYKNPVVNEQTLCVFISQSGETADTIAALEEAKKLGAFTLCICNVERSSITRLADACLYTKTGLEIGVASTKAFTAQLMMMYVLTNVFAVHLNKQTEAAWAKKREGLYAFLSALAQQVQAREQVLRIAQQVQHSKSMLFMGRGILFPIALEGSLKMKEISYIHAEGFAAGEMKHGHIALIDERMYTVFIVPSPEDELHKKVISNMQEIKARKGKIIGIITAGDAQAHTLCDDVVVLQPIKDNDLLPILSVIPLQQLAYYVAVLLGRDVDQPRNLAKSVTVE